MSIQINVLDRRCSAGSTVTGTVLLRGEEDIGVEYIALTLQARCKTKVSKSNGNNRTTYRGRAPLIFIRQILFTGPHTLHPGHTWPFTFTLPVQCSVQQTDNFNQSDRQFNLDPGQSLPPSFTDSHAGFSGWTSDCFIKYELEATLEGTGSKVFGLRNLSSTRQLDFRTFRFVQTPDPQLIPKSQTIVCHSLRLRPGYEHATLTLKEKFKSIRTDKLPVAFFNIHAQLPQVGAVQQPVPAFLKLEYDAERSTNPQPPMVLLRKCSIQLEACTFIQCFRFGIWGQDDMSRNWDETWQIGLVDFSEKMDSAPALTEDFNLFDVMRTSIPGSFPPTFSTFNIRRTYKLHLKLSVECAQKGFKAEYHTRDFILLAKDYMLNVIPAPVGSATNPNTDEVAPAYSKDIEPPPPGYYGPKTS